MWPLELVRMPACPPSGLGSCPSPRPCRQVIPCPWPQFHQEGPSRAGPGHRRQGGPVSWPPSASCRMSQQDRKQRVTGPPPPPRRWGWGGAGPPPAPPLPRAAQVHPGASGQTCHGQVAAWEDGAGRAGLNHAVLQAGPSGDDSGPN